MINLFGVPISITSKDQALAVVTHWLRQWRILNTEYRIPNKKSNFPHSEFSIQHSVLFPKLIVTPNPEIIVSAQKDPEFLKALQSADLAIPDGVGIVWALRILNTEYRIPNTEWKSKLVRLARYIHSKFSIQNSVFSLSRLSGLELMESLIALAARRGWRVMLMGGKPGVAEKAAKTLQKNGYMATWLHGYECNNETMKQCSHETMNDQQVAILAISGPPDIDKATPHERNELLNSINSFSPDLLFVAFGHGKQEKWLRANRHRLRAGVAMGVGGALDQITDPSLRPPAYINSIGLGWLYRLVRQPWRWRRQLALVKFVVMVVNHVVFHKNHENLRKTRKILQKGS